MHWHSHPAMPECKLDESLYGYTSERIEADGIPDWAFGYNVGDIIHAERKGIILSLPMLGWSTTETNGGRPVVEERPVQRVFQDEGIPTPEYYGVLAIDEETHLDVRLEGVSG